MNDQWQKMFLFPFDVNMIHSLQYLFKAKRVVNKMFQIPFKVIDGSFLLFYPLFLKGQHRQEKSYGASVTFFFSLRI